METESMRWWDSRLSYAGDQNVRVRSYRRLQSRWREVELRLPPGSYVDRNGQERLLGSRLPEGSGPHHQLLSREAVDYALARLPGLEVEGRKAEPNRLWLNMLSSQPLCFSLFGHLAHHREAGARVLDAVLPWTVDAIDDVLVEHAPPAAARGSAATGRQHGIRHDGDCQVRRWATRSRGRDEVHRALHAEALRQAQLSGDHGPERLLVQARSRRDRQGAVDQPAMADPDASHRKLPQPWSVRCQCGSPDRGARWSCRGSCPGHQALAGRPRQQRDARATGGRHRRGRRRAATLAVRARRFRNRCLDLGLANTPR
jgi:hypothetical protein